MISNDDKVVCPLSAKDEPPWVDGTKFLCNGNVVDYDDKTKEYFSSIIMSSHERKTSIGSVLQMNEPMVEEALYKARCAWNEGRGVWPRSKRNERVVAANEVLKALLLRRDEIIRIILWDACKTLKEANEEFQKAMQFAESAIQEYETNLSDGHIAAPVGIVLCWGAEVNSFVETYRILMPALVTGNIVIVKVPCVGGLVHMLTMDAFMKNLPSNIVQFIVGPIDVVAAPLMSTGEISMLALAGARSLADKLIHAHPCPHRLKLQLRLDNETLAVVLPDADLSRAASEVTKAVRHSRNHAAGLKLVMAHTSVVQAFLNELCRAVRLLKCGLPWTKGVDITPVPGNNQPERLQELLIDALQKGAMIVNSEEGGGRLLPEFHGTIMQPAVVYPVNDTMELWRVRVTGPIVAVASYTHIAEVRAYISHSSSDVQACVFSAHPAHGELPKLLHELPHQVDAIEVNQVCLEQHLTGYGAVPAGREDGSWSAAQALKAFSCEPVMRGFGTEGGGTADAGRGQHVEGGAAPQSPHKASEDCAVGVGVPGPFPSPVGIADMHLHHAESLVDK